jgi:hypothetical protein
MKGTMPRIKGRFAPLTEELGSDERFLIGCSDLEKLLYILIIYTCHMTHHQAPIDPSYYQRRFILRARKHQIKSAIEAICLRFPMLKCSNEKLSLLNSATYESQILPKCPKKQSKNQIEKQSDEQFIASLKNDPLNAHVDFDREFQKMDAWLLKNPSRKKTRKFISMWVGRIEKPVLTASKRSDPWNIPSAT